MAFSTSLRRCLHSSSVLRRSLPQLGESMDRRVIVDQLEAAGGSGQIELLMNTDDPVANINIINRGRGNAISASMMAQLAQCMYAIEHALRSRTWNGCAVIVRGDGMQFCSGADFGTIRDKVTTPTAGEAMSLFMADTLTRFSELPLITVAAIEGAAIGGGAELSCYMDHRVMAENSTIQFVHSSLAVSPGWGGGVRLNRLVGPSKALIMLSGAQPVSAGQAMLYGLADEVCQPGESELIAREFLSDAVANAMKKPEAVRAAKMVIRNATRLSDGHLSDIIATERKIFTSLWASPENTKAINERTRK